MQDYTHTHTDPWTKTALWITHLPFFELLLWPKTHATCIYQCNSYSTHNTYLYDMYSFYAYISPHVTFFVFFSRFSCGWATRQFSFQSRHPFKFCLLNGKFLFKEGIPLKKKYFVKWQFLFKRSHPCKIRTSFYMRVLLSKKIFLQTRSFFWNVILSRRSSFN